MSSIPASELVAVNPSVLGVGGSALEVIGLMLTTNAQVPLGTVASFPDATEVGNYFGLSSTEAALAAVYFQGFDGSAKKPGSVLFAQYNQSAAAAYLRGGAFGLTVAQMQALSGSLTVAIDGYSHVIASISLAADASFSAAAAAIQAAFTNPVQANITGSIAGTTLTVTATSAIAIAAGQTVGGTGVTAGTIILSQLSGSTGGTGTYLVNTSQTALSGAKTCSATPALVTYDSVSGAFVVTSGVTGAPSTAAFATGTLAVSLNLTSATGAVLSQGGAAASPAAFMNALIQVSTNWVTFMTCFDPDGGVGSSVKQAFAGWNDTQNNRFAYVCSDTDITPTQAVPATSSLGYILGNNDDSGTCLVYDPTDFELAAFVCGAAASIDFSQTDGRITFAFKSQAGLTASVTNATVANNLGGDPQGSGRGNGYNFYGTYGSADPNFTWFQRGFVTGAFSWFDSYINQVWLNSQMQAALLNLLNNARSIPYNAAGNALIESALADVIAAALNFGAFAPGAISASQIAAVNQAAGADVATTLQTQGYYIQVKPASSAARAARTSPPATFWYLDRGSVQAITLASVALQ